MKQRRFSVVLFCFIAFFYIAPGRAEPEIVIKGLFKNAAVVIIDGRQQLLKVGQRTGDGVLLVSASSKEAVLEYGGQRRTLSLTQGIGAVYTDAKQTEVRLNSQLDGHFFGSALINGKRAQFMVDTGATWVSMSSKTADLLGLGYEHGTVTRVNTAQGVTRGYRVSLRRVEVGGIRVNNVEAIVLEGEYPLDMLLGNSFLSRLDMNIDNGVMILQSKY